MDDFGLPSARRSGVFAGTDTDNYTGRMRAFKNCKRIFLGETLSCANLVESAYDSCHDVYLIW